MPRRRRPLSARGLGRARAPRFDSSRRRFARALRICGFLGLLTLPVAIAGANTVAESRAGQGSSAVGVNDLKPAECAGLTLSTLYTGASSVAGGTTNDLILGGSAAQTLSGSDGDDCILGGDGDDQVDGGVGADVCIGGPGTDTFGSDCETTVQGEPTF